MHKTFLMIWGSSVIISQCILYNSVQNRSQAGGTMMRMHLKWVSKHHINYFLCWFFVTQCATVLNRKKVKRVVFRKTYIKKKTLEVMTKEKKQVENLRKCVRVGTCRSKKQNTRIYPSYVAFVQNEENQDCYE